jgi:hypothetical protein
MPLSRAPCHDYQTEGGAELRYAVLVTPQALSRIHAALADRGTIDILSDVRQLLSELAAPAAGCVVFDPALVPAVAAETIAVSVARFPRPLVAFSSVTTAALESGVVLAQRTPACFVFRGTPNEQAALERALLLPPDLELAALLLATLDRNMRLLPAGLCKRLVSMFRSGDGPRSPDALAAACSLARRSLDRVLNDAGFASARLVVEAPHIMSGYGAITGTRIPLKDIATMLGYNTPRTLDAQLRWLIGVSCGTLRSHPLSAPEVVSRMTVRLTHTDNAEERPAKRPRRIRGSNEPSLTLVSGGSHTHRVRRKASGGTER